MRIATTGMQELKQRFTFGQAAGVSSDANRLAGVVAGVAGFLVCEQLAPLFISGRNPERVLEVLLPPFAPVARALSPLVRWTSRRGC